jgi:eukaryotic-like serine/threonine-protein kinase
MQLVAGTKLGPYEILAPLGAGGMGEVYRARDTRLERIVAIKTIARGHTSDPDLLRRFEREARLISALSHPHICALFDVGHEGEIDYLVMEYLEGDTLAKRLERGPLPVSQLLQFGIDIAEALETAHRAGIIHRDLKPGNIVLAKSGLKLLDFGLAKLEASGPVPVLTALATMATKDSNITGVGTILGTMQYMAPEQLEGRESDAQTDIFAFGAILYEMATGQRAFPAKSQASLIAAILSSEPTPITQLQPLTPLAFDRLVGTCLAKEPERRWQTGHDVRLQLEWIRDSGSQSGVPPPVAKRRINGERVAWTAAMFLLLLAALFAIGYFRRAPIPPREVIFTVEPQPGYKVSPDGDSALSPDGALVAYRADDAKGRKSLWVRSLESLSSRRLEGSESNTDYYSFIWTPDGKAVIAPVNGKLVRLSAIGGANEVLCDKFDAAPAAMNSEGTILAWTAPPTKVFSVSPEDCTPHPRSPSDVPGSDVGYAYPHFLPDGKHFLFAAVHKGKDKHHDVLVSSLDGAAPRVVIRNASFPKYIDSGYVLFSRDGYLMAQKFDPKSQRSNGDAFLVHSNQLDFYAAFGWAAFDASRNGVISAKEQIQTANVLRWYSRSGVVLQTIGEPEHRVTPRLTARGDRAAACLFDPRTHASDLWSVDLEQGTWRRESFQDRPACDWAAWTPDGTQLVYSALIGNEVEMFLKNAGSSGNGEILQTGLSGTKVVGDVSPDGASIVYLFEGDTEVSIYGQSLHGGKPFFVARTESGAGEEGPPRLSPDGHWVAYQSSESGSSEIYVRPFSPEAAAAGVQVSSGGGHEPRWSHAGNELFYRTNDSRIVSVSWRGGKQIEFSRPVILFRLPEGAQYDVVDGKRFLVNEPAGPTSGPLFVIVNWKPEAQNPK